MYNVFLLSACNLKCSYCFAEAYMRSISDSSRHEESPEKLISIENYERILEFLKASDISIVSLTGGEPTLHPDFFSIVNLSLEKGFTVSIKSNATWNENIRRGIENLPNEGIHYLLNINHPSALGKHLWQRVTRNVTGIKGRWFDFQFNIYSRDFDDTYLLDLAKEARPNRVIWSLSHLVKGSAPDSLMDPISIRENYSKQILRFASKLHDACIQTVGVHGITPCMFSEEDYQKLLSFGGSLESTCKPVFDFLPDLSVQFCFPMGGYFGKKYIHGYKHLQEINLEFLEKLVFIRSSSYPLAECFECPYAKSQACHGGCIAQRYAGKEYPISINEMFFDQIPFLAEKFQIKEVPFEGADSHDNSVGFVLIDEQLGNTYPLDQSLAALFSGANGLRTLEDLYRISFSNYDNQKAARLSFKEIVTDLIKRNVFALRPLKKFPESMPVKSEQEHE